MDNAVLCVVGPTACGKTKMGVALARRFHGEVVSVDSMQLYRGMAIGTAAPTAEEMEGIPHHMVAVADPRESWSAARYAAEADKCVQDILRRGKRPVLVGGTGLYLDALVRGTDFAAGSHGGAIRQQLQQRMERQGAAALLAELQTIDPAAAARLHLRDEKRIVRALEVYYETGETITEHDRKSRRRRPATAPCASALPSGTGRTCGRASTAGWTTWWRRGFCRRWRRCCKAACHGMPRRCRPSATSSFWPWRRDTPLWTRPSRR